MYISASTPTALLDIVIYLFVGICGYLTASRNDGLGAATTNPPNPGIQPSYDPPSSRLLSSRIPLLESGDD